MAVHKFINNGGQAGAVVIDGATIRIVRPVAFEAPKAAAALGKAVKQITDQVKETGLAITRELAAREALLTKSNLRGIRFEDALSGRLPALVRAMGRVERCATVSGDKARNAGDYLITLNG